MLGALVGAWEEVRAQQEAAQKLEAELFRTKARNTTILTEEVRLPPAQQCVGGVCSTPRHILPHAKDAARPFALLVQLPFPSKAFWLCQALHDVRVAVATKRQHNSLGPALRQWAGPPLPLPRENSAWGGPW